MDPDVGIFEGYKTMRHVGVQQVGALSFAELCDVQMLLLQVKIYGLGKRYKITVRALNTVQASISA